MPCQFDPNAVYSREELAVMLLAVGIRDVDTFLNNLQIPRRFKNVVLGADIVKAMSAPPLVDVPKAPNLGKRPAKLSGKNRSFGLQPISRSELLDKSTKR